MEGDSLPSGKFNGKWNFVSEGPWSRRRKHQTIVWEDKLLLLGGFDGEAAFDLNDVWSWNGNSWNLVSPRAGWSGRDGHQVVSLNGSIYVLGGTDDPYYCKSDVWRSDDGGVTWFNLCYAPWPERWQHGACIHEGYMYIIGGWGGRYLNDVWRSRDGLNWEEVSRNAAWKARMFHSVLSFNNCIYVLGGHDGRTQLRDVWASSDGGVTWTQVCAQAQWEGRQGQACVQMAGYIFLMGGFGGATRFNDMWKSKDCAHWILVNRQCTWSARQGHAAICYKNAIYILGGFDESGLRATTVRTDSLGEMPISAFASTGSKAANNDSGQRSVVTVTVACVLECMSKLNLMRLERKHVADSIQLVVDVVTDALTACNSNVPPRVQSRDQLVNSSNLISDGMMTTSISFEDLRLQSGKKRRVSNPTSPRIDKKMIPTNEEVEFELAEYGYGVSDENALYADDELDTSRFMESAVMDSSARYAPCLNIAIAPRIHLNHAANDKLREEIEHDKSSMTSIQRRVRDAAEKANLEVMNELIDKRLELAVNACGKVTSLLTQIIEVHSSLCCKESTLTQFRSKLEDLCNSLCLIEDLNDVRLSGSGSTVEPQESILWSDWHSALADYKSLSNFVEKDQTDRSIASFSQDINEISEITGKISNLATKMTMSNSESSQSFLSSRFRTRSVSTDALLAINASANSTVASSPRTIVPSLSTKVPMQVASETLAQEYERVNMKLDSSKMEVKKLVDTEVLVIEKELPKLNQLLQLALVKGSDLLRGLHSQIASEILEVASMQRELAEWREIVTLLADKDALHNRIEELLAENSAAEEKLLYLEDKRIDSRSLLEKASLKGNKGSRRATRASSLSSSHDELASASNDEIEDLKLAFADAERAVKEIRREMRNWFRGVRLFAVNYAPELFHLLPDLQAPGSVLGDGGYGENAGLPRKRLAEYDDIKPLLVTVIPPADISAMAKLLANQSSSGGNIPFSKSPTFSMAAVGVRSLGTNSSAGRHVLLRATYDGEEVVLKGFIMNESHQRKGFEREISILGKLHNDHIISPRAIVEDTGAFATESNPGVHVAVYIEYPYCKGGNLSGWLKASARKPWELQGVARQLLYGLMYLHDHGVIHMDIKPSNVLLHEDGRVVLSDFELSREVQSRPSNAMNIDEELTTTSRSGTRGFMAPEVESGNGPQTASDMYSFGVLILFMHFPGSLASLVPGAPPALPPTCDPELCDLIRRLLVLNPAQRPTAAAVLMHPYFRGTFVERLMQEGEVVEQNRKLEAVRNLLHRVRSENNSNIERITIRREHVVYDVLNYFSTMQLSSMRAHIRAIFVGEVGVDEGGLLTEMFSIFFEEIFSGSNDLFVTCEGGGSLSSAVVLPNTVDCSAERMLKLRAFGRSIIKALYEGRRVGSRISASVFKFITDTAPDMRDLQTFDPQTARSLQWTLATAGVDELGFHFESVGHPELGAVTDANKSKFVRMQIDRILVQTRKPHLTAIKNGFIEALQAISSDAAPFMNLLSHTDWRVMLCGDNAVNGPQIVAALKFTGFPKKSQIPQWLKEIILSSSDDHLRQFLVFVTGSPSIQQSRMISSSLSMSTSSSGESSTQRVEINVRHQSRSTALPTAHTCFFHLDIPDYKDKDTLKSKLMYAIQNATTFEIV